MTQLIFKEHRSQLDQSVNFEHAFEDHPGRLEARYVRRIDDYFIIYLSSQTGCKQACRMCWLTATGQTKYRDTTVEEYLQQAEEVFAYYRTQKPATLVHFNFMARGEPLDNPIFIANADRILMGLAAMAIKHGLAFKFLISTIMPKSLGDLRLTDIFKEPTMLPEIYYSLYTVEKDVRRKWLPKAKPVTEALDLLLEWQHATHKVPKIHFAFIEGVNDSHQNVYSMACMIRQSGLKVNLNIVRYNPPSLSHSREPSEEKINELVDVLVRYLNPAKWRIVPRVGTDVMASCGTFLN